MATVKPERWENMKNANPNGSFDDTAKNAKCLFGWAKEDTMQKGKAFRVVTPSPHPLFCVWLLLHHLFG